MFKNILQKFEDPKRPLLGPNVKALRFWGMLMSENIWNRRLYLLVYIFVFSVTFSEYLDMWVVRKDMELLLTNIKITIVSTITCIKVGSFLYWQGKWKSVIEYVTRADEASRNKSDGVDKSIIDSNTRYCRKITYMYWTLMITTNCVVILMPVIKFLGYPSYRLAVQNGTEILDQVLRTWAPFDKTTMAGFLGISLFQIIGAMYGCGWITCFDTTALVIMVFFKCELELIKRSCYKIFDIDSDLEAMDRIKACHLRHVELVKYSALFNSCQSPVLFVYVVVCSVMLCANVYQVSVETNPLNKLLIAEYLIFGVSQLFLYCWHGNEVFYMSNEVMRGPYISKWWRRKVCRRELILLTGQLHKQIAFSAGPMVNLNVRTFTNILKGAYSYYTLLVQQK